MKQKYLAHISEDRTREQSVKAHLLETAELAEKFASTFHSDMQAAETAKAHDLGKYSDGFQERLFGGERVDHATAGAKELCGKGNIFNYCAAYCVAGHHGGMPDGGSVGDGAGAPTLQGRLKNSVNDYSPFKDEIQLHGLSAPPLKILGKGGFTLSFWTRMLFSCLVDADFLNTEAFMNQGIYRESDGEPLSVLMQKYNDHVSSWLDNQETDTVDGRRTEILRACLKMGKGEQGLYTLTVPTGGGKTVSSLGFALRHGIEHEMERIVYVIPFTSIIEQNAQVFRKILGDENVLEDHCNVTFEDEQEEEKHRLAAENYDKPVVVTTNVQFFESLFSNKPSKCRKLHNLTKSVIIFDEVQMLPTEYLKPCIQAISELVYNYGCTAVLCTATQPALKKYFPKELAEDIKEISPRVQDMYALFKRTNVVNGGVMTKEDLLDALKQKKQALCILNKRIDVQEVYRQLINEGENGVYHLSTYMYPLHRKRILKTVREKLAEGKPCRLIATSLIEAGVDLNFPSVYRELAGIDSVIQAAGRCNREGKLSADQCKTIFFQFENQGSGRLPSSIKQMRDVSAQIVRKYEDITDLKAIHDYFARLYDFRRDFLDKHKVIEAFEKGSRSCSFPFQTVAKEFHLIEQDTKTVLIALEDSAKEIAEKMVDQQYSMQLMRKAGKYCINLYENDYSALWEMGMITPLFDGFAVLEQSTYYDENCGIQLNTEMGIGHYY
ncbi:CRISPR-associated helicase Cas3' [Ihubacter sp. rT4E-8]|uniref:CRISPR-associated helicase Cas3' n=1 Tax=Ihubacter sp. rT4E-8 TaxID=3242369 RepID=UPI003CEB73CE